MNYIDTVFLVGRQSSCTIEGEEVLIQVGIGTFGWCEHRFPLEVFRALVQGRQMCYSDWIIGNNEARKGNSFLLIKEKSGSILVQNRVFPPNNFSQIPQNIVQELFSTE